MNHGIEIRWHGRGGQGAKTAALLLADVAFKTGAYVQGFPEYGPERMGAPITAYNRISRDEIRVHSNIYTPDLVVVVDETLLESVDVTAGLKEDGAIIINTAKYTIAILKKKSKNVVTHCVAHFFKLSSPNSINLSICFLKHWQLCSIISGVSIALKSVLPEGSPT